MLHDRHVGQVEVLEGVDEGAVPVEEDRVHDPDGRLPGVSEPVPNAAIQRVIEAAARKGVKLTITVFDESTHTAEEAASAVGAEIGQIVKSLIFVAPGDDAGLVPILCLVSGPNRVDLARLAAVVGEPEIRRANAREANDLSGFVIGGIPPIGHRRPIRAVMDPDLGRYELVWAAAGTPNAVFPVPPATLRTLANAVVAPIAEARPVPPREAPARDATSLEDRSPGSATATAD